MKYANWTPEEAQRLVELQKLTVCTIDEHIELARLQQKQAICAELSEINANREKEGNR